MKRKRSLKERAGALILAFALVLTGIVPDGALRAAASEAEPVAAAATEEKAVKFQVQEEYQNQSVDHSGAVITIYEGDKALKEDLKTDKDGEAEYKIAAYDSSKKYTYSVEKTGFEPSGKKKLENTNQVTLAMNAIQVPPQSLSLIKGENQTVSISNMITNAADGEPGYQWKSDNEQVATVDPNGKVTAAGKGTATITVSRHRETTSVPVTVSEKFSMGISVTPEGGAGAVDVKTVKITVTGVPKDAAGTVEIYRGQEKIGEASGSADRTFNYTSNDLRGDVTFTAKYVPNPPSGEYLATEVSTKGLSYKQRLPLELEQTKETIIYGDLASAVRVKDDTVKGRELEFVSSNSDVAAVDENGKITVKSAGKTTITVTAKENSEYTASTAEYKLTVNKKDLGGITLNDFTWVQKDQGTNGAKIYDGTDIITLEGTLKGSKGLVNQDSIQLRAKARIQEIFGTGKSAAEVDSPVKGKKYECTGETGNYSYTLKTEEKKLTEEVSYTIEQRPVYIQAASKADVKETEVEYNVDDISAKVAEENIIKLAGEKGKIKEDKNSGLLGNDTIEEQELESITEVGLKEDKYYVGTYSGAILPEITGDLAADSHYVLKVYRDTVNAVPDKYCGTLKVVQEKTEDDAKLWDRIIVSGGVTDDTGKIWVNAAGSLTLKVNSGKEEQYDQVVLNGKETDYVNAVNIGNLTVRENDNQDLSELMGFYLNNSGDINGNTRTTADKDAENVNNKIPENKIVIDNKNPEVKIVDSSDDEFKKEITASDDGSGINKITSKVITVKADATEDEVEKAFRAAAINTEGWDEIIDGKVNLSRPGADSESILLVKASDKAGNEIVAGSDGSSIVLGQPKISFNITSKPVNGIYKDDIEYELTVTDPEAANSDIAKIVAEVTSNNKKVEGEKANHTDSYELTSDELKNLGTEYTIKGKITAKNCNSNNVTLKIKTVDAKGNDSIREERTFAIDKTAPTIEVSYDNNTSKYEGYFNENRTMTITYTERNFVEENAKFTMAENQEITLTDLMKGKAEGIQAVKISDSEVGKPAKELTDARKNVYKITFGEEGKDYDFTVKPSVTDQAGNKNSEVKYAEGTAAKETFTIDQTAPVIEVSFDNNEVKNEKYFNEERVMALKFTERNFEETEILFDTDGDGKGDTSLEALKDVNGIAVEAAKPEGDVHTYNITFGKAGEDIDFHIVPMITDKAGNVNSEPDYTEDTKAGTEFTVDMKAPVLTVAYQAVSEDGQSIEAIPEVGTEEAGRLYKNRTIEAIVTISDQNFGEENTFADRIQADVTASDAAGNKVDGVVNQNDIAKDMSGWEAAEGENTYSQKFTFKTEANYIFNLTYEDVAGNKVKLADTEGYCFTVDKTAPSGKVEVHSDVVEKVLNVLTFGYFGKTPIKVSTTSEDAISPVETSFYKYEPGRAASGEIPVLTPEELEKAGWTRQSGTGKDGFEVVNPAKTYVYETKDAEQFVPYEKLEDRAGNITYIYDNGIVHETKESKINIKIKTPAPETSFKVKEQDVVYDGDVEFNISVDDGEEGQAAVYSGISQINYRVLKDGEPGSIKGEKTFEAANRVESGEINGITIPSAEYNSNDIIIEVTVVDNAGNISTEREAVKIDTAAPEISIKYNLNQESVHNKKYFNADRVMTITYKERNINPDGLTFDVKAGTEFEKKNITLKELENSGKDYGITIEKVSDTEENVNIVKRTDNRELTYNITFNGGENDDMDYYIVPHTEDQAGHKDSGAVFAEGTIVPEEFTVDKNRPVMQVEYFRMNGEIAEKIDVSTDKAARLYQNQTVRAVVTLTERNFSLEDAFSEEYSQVVPKFTWTKHDGTNGSVAAFENAATDSEGWISEGTERKQYFDFVADGDYSFSMEYTDLAGNKCEQPYETHYVTVDKTAPEMTVTYDVEGTELTPAEVEELESGRVYKNKTVTATVKINERNFERENEAVNFEDGQSVLKYTAVDVNGREVETEDYTKSANTRENWSSEGYIRTQVFTFENDANYVWSFQYKDLAGNEVSFGDRNFTVDTTPPEGTVKIRDKSWSDFIAMITFGFFTNTSEEVIMTSEDATAGVASTQYYKYHPSLESRGEFKGLTREQLDRVTDWTDGFRAVVRGNEQVVVYEKIVDKSGNVTYINADKGVIADNVSPDKPVITITTAKPSQDIYNGNVNFTIDVKDPAAGGTYAGLKSVSYEVLKDGVVTQSGSYDGALTDWTQRTQHIRRNETVSAQKNNSNDVKIKVYAEDYAGNKSEAEKAIKIDITKPTVKITYDLNNPSNGKYYNATRTATVTVTERNFDPNAVDFTITNTDGTRPSISGWTSSANAGVSDSATHTCRVSFSADGDYTMTMNCTDKANNRSEYTQVDEFTIDKTVPTIQVAFDNNNAANGTYYNAPRTATITVNEHNFNGSEVQTAISASLQSQGISAPGVHGWSGNGDVHTASVNFGTDGDYSFTVNYTDLAGNAAEVYTVDQFTIDQTKPEIEIFDIEDKSANNGTVAPGVNYSDVNYDVSGVNITIKGPNHAEQAVDGARTAIANGERIKMADFAHEPEVDDVYTLTAQVKDLAGNVDEKTVVFSVNRFGSNYIFSDGTAEFLEDYYSNEEEDLVVTEINVDTLVHNGISYGRDGQLVNLEEGSDYSVQASGGETSWKSYQYTIHAENFEEEGLYNVTIDSTDRATNEVNNKVKDANIEFVIDKTAPTVVITGAENDARYTADSRDIEISVADNVAMGDMDLYLDDEEKAAASFDSETILKQRGEISYTLGSSKNKQSVKAVATDAAGNSAEAELSRVLVTSNLFVQFYMNTPLLVGSCVGVPALAALIVFLILKKKKSEKEADR